MFNKQGLQKNLYEKTRNISISCQWSHLFQLLCNTRKHSQKEPFGDVLQNKCSQKFLKIYNKIPVLESLFNDKTDSSLIKKRLQYSFL